MKGLYELIIEDEQGTATQEITVTYGETTVTYRITRDLSEGGNISEVENHFENFPYLEDGEKKYDDELTVLEHLFTHYDETYADLDQLLWEMDEGETITANPILNFYDKYGNIKTEEIEITIKLDSNSIE